MKQKNNFVKNAGSFVTAGLALSEIAAVCITTTSKQTSKWKGFNLLDFFRQILHQPANQQQSHFRWMRDWGFDFVRLPIAYPYYLTF